jgi:hypothetical protein
MVACKYFVNRQCWLAIAPADKTAEKIECLICVLLESVQGKKVVLRIATVGAQ